MRLYEVVYILDPALEEGPVDEKLAALHAVATASEGAEVVAVDHWGSRQLAYPVEGRKSGYYVVAHLRAEPGDLPEFERLLKLDDDIIRSLIVLNEGEPSSGMSVVAERPETAGDEEDGGGEDGDGDSDDDADDGDADDDDGDDDSPPEFSGGAGRRRRHEGPPIELLNYKDVSTLSRFLTEQGKILPRRTTRVTAGFQRQLGRAVKRARFLALIPYLRDHEG